MENLKSLLLWLIILAVLGALGYWAVTTLQSGTEHIASQQAGNREEEKKENETPELEPVSEEIVPEEIKEEPKPETKPVVASTHQDLINELQKLVDDKVFMKLKSVGTRVGTVQKFLNIYNNTSNKVDNDYGPGMQKAVMAFQKAEGVAADGEAGPGTFEKMIEWLKKKG
ncbi:MAG: peptidoglycan-binding domain-containing protein [Patescibacteria group bacterium]